MAVETPKNLDSNNDPEKAELNLGLTQITAAVITNNPILQDERVAVGNSSMGLDIWKGSDLTSSRQAGVVIVETGTKTFYLNEVDFFSNKPPKTKIIANVDQLIFYSDSTSKEGTMGQTDVRVLMLTLRETSKDLTSVSSLLKTTVTR